MVPTLSHSVEYSFTLGLRQQLPAEHYNLIYLTLGWIETSTMGLGYAERLHKVLNFTDLDGVLIYGAGITNRVRPEAIYEITQCYPDIPVINVGNITPNIPSVVVDNRAPFREFARHLVLKKGLRNIAFVRGPEDNYDAKERRAGFLEGLSECGLTLPEKFDWPGHFSVGSGSIAVSQNFNVSDAPEAIVCANDLCAIGVINRLVELGIQVPQQCMVIGFDDLEYAKIIPVALSTGRYPIFEMGKVAANLMTNWLLGVQPDIVTQVDSSVVFRASTADDGDPRSQIAKLRDDDLAFYSRDSNSDRLHINRAINRGASIQSTLPLIAANLIDVGCVQFYYFKYDHRTNQLTDIYMLDGEKFICFDKQHPFFSGFSIASVFQSIKHNNLSCVLSAVQANEHLFGYVVTVITQNESDFTEFIANEFCKKNESELLTKETEFLKKQVLQTEQMATLGRLVSGLAHELNTPLGVSLVAASNLADEIRTIRSLDVQKKMTKTAFSHFLESCEETQKILFSSLKRTADLVASFKKVSVDQHLDENRKINLGNYLEEVLLSLRPKLRQSKVAINSQIANDINITTNPGLWAQLITNLVLNAIIHAFDDGREQGKISLSLRRNGQQIEFDVVDDGNGIPADKLKHIFEPFFTTRRANGGTGLGLHIVYNLVTQKLMGQITVSSRTRVQYPNHSGTRFSIIVPIAD